MKIASFFALALALFTISQARTADDKPENTSPEGNWVAIETETGGKKYPAKAAQKMKLVIKDSKYTSSMGKFVDKGTVKFDTTANPMTIDIVMSEGPNKGKTQQAIFEQKDDTLKLCIDLSGKERPKSFETKEDNMYYLTTYKREKEKK